jgi:hypothetical protein
MRYVRRFLLALVGVVLVSACSDLPTGALAPTADLDSASVPHLDEAEGCVSDGFCVLPPISGPGECDLWTSLDWCAGECEESAPGSPEVVSADGCSDPGGTDPGGGGTEPPPSDCPEWDPNCEKQPPPADTCNTGDPIIEDSTVQEGFAELMMDSNPDASQPQRLEQAGWIVADGSGGYFVQRWTNSQSLACGIVFDEIVPANAVGYVHTHPFRLNEEVRTCGQNFDGTYPRYRGGASEDDINTMKQLAAMLPGSKGYILDKSGISIFSETTRVDRRDQRFPTCGY